MHKQAINHKQAIIGGGYLFTENACSTSNNMGQASEVLHQVKPGGVVFPWQQADCVYV